MEGFDKLMRGAGVVVALMGAFIIWRGVTKIIPIMGIVHGGLFTLAGLLFLVVGLLFIILPGRKARKQAKAEKLAKESK